MIRSKQAYFSPILDSGLSDASVHGVDMLLPAKINLDEFIFHLHTLSKWLPVSAKFATIDAPTCFSVFDHCRIVECIRSLNMIDRFCFVITSMDMFTDSLVRSLRHSGIKIILGGVGPRSRFSDILAYPVDAIILDRDFISDLSGDPSASSILDAVVLIAKNAGLRTIASRVPQKLQVEMLFAAGVNYVSRPPVSDDISSNLSGNFAETVQ